MSTKVQCQALKLSFIIMVKLTKQKLCFRETRRYSKISVHQLVDEGVPNNRSNISQ